MKKFLEPEITILNFNDDISLEIIKTSPQGIQTVDGPSLNGDQDPIQ